MKRVSVLLITTLCTSLNSEDILSILDKYHNTISSWVVLKSDQVDKILARSNDQNILSKTVIGIEYTIGYDTKDSLSNNIDFSFGLDLPRFKNRLHLMAESYKYNLNNLKKEPPKLFTDEEKTKSYNISFKYDKIKTEKFIFSFTSGARFDKNKIEPYIGIIGNYHFKPHNNWKSSFKNSIIVYTTGEIADTLSIENIYTINKSSLVGINSNLGLTSASKIQTISSEISYYKELSNNSYYKVGALLYGNLENLANPKVDTYRVYTQYKNNIASRDWLYYKVTPSISWQEKYDYKHSYKLELSIGVKFGAI